MPYIPNQRGSKAAMVMNNSNLSGLNNNNSRRNITLSGANMFVGSGRPKTAAMHNLRPPTGMPTKGGMNNMTGIGGRAISANLTGGMNPRVRRYEDIIQRLKRML